MHIDWLSLIEHVAPLAASAIPGGDKVAPFIVTGIKIAQNAHDQSKAAGGPGLTGQDKLNLAVTEVVNGVSAVSAVEPEKVNPAQVSDAISKTVDTAKAIAAVVNTAKIPDTPPDK